MRILHCIPGMSVGGAERQLGLLAPAQALAGTDVHVALIRGGPYLGSLLSGPVQVHHVPASNNHDPRIGLSLLRLIRELKPAIVQTWLPQMDVFAGAAARMTSRPWILSERSMSAAYRARWKDSVLRPVLGAGADAIVANSPAGLKYWAARVKEGTLLRVVPNALPVREIRATPRATLSPDPAQQGKALILYAGRLSPEKNLPLFLAAVALLTRERRVQVVLCGEGPSRSELGRLVDTLGLAGTVTLAGLRDDLWGLMKSARAVVNPSRFEGQPNVVLEAAAAEVPLILSDIPGHRNVLDDDSALFFQVDSPQELARAIEHTLDNSTEADTRRRNASHVADAFSVERAVAGYQAVYDELIAG